MKKFIPCYMLCSTDVSKDVSRMRKRAISNVISTVILVSIMLIIAVSVIGFATNVFAIQSDSVEFDQAKNTMINFAGILEQVSSKQGSAGYVLFNPRAGGPSFLSNVGNMAVDFQGTNLASISGYFNTLKYRGGSLSSAVKSYLRGTEDVVTYNNNSTLGSVYLEQVNGSWIVLDYARIGVMNLGTFNFSKGIINGVQTFETVNLIQVQYINIATGNFSGSGSINMVATCNNINVSYMLFSKTFEPPDFTVTLTIGDSVNIKSFRVPDVNSNYDIIIMIIKSDVEISMVG